MQPKKIHRESICWSKLLDVLVFWFVVPSLISLGRGRTAKAPDAGCGKNGLVRHVETEASDMK